MIEAFAWSDRFATGIASVDEQHQRLFGLINQVGEMIAHDSAATGARTEGIIKELADYARFHFADEERVWLEGGADPARLEAHKEQHRAFTQQVITLWNERGKMAQPAQTMYSFLSAWLVYHILGDDQSMALGLANAPRRDLPTDLAELSRGALLQAMDSLYRVVSEQNKELARANAELEQRVQARTEELNEAYAKLAADNQTLKELLATVEKTQGQLLQSEKMASIGQLAAGVAHEINNPIGFVSSNLRSLGRYAEDLLRIVDAAQDSPAAQTAAAAVDLPFLREDLLNLLRESNEGLERVRTIVANLKDFSHVDEAEWQDADVIAGLESTVSVVWHELKYKAEVVRELAPLPRVRCIPAQLNQVFVNLLVNAAQAIEGHGTITLRSGQEGAQIWVEVADTGVGMSEEVQRRMFEPFYTTKPVGKGTGLGLSLAYDIIAKHHGRFEVQSRPGAGTRIRIHLPIQPPHDEREDPA